jgi:hypothetical protein
MIRRFTVPVTTAADGSATAYTPWLSGYVQQIQYEKDDFADGVDFTITADETGQTIWTEENVNASSVKAPRMATHNTAGVAATFDDTRPVLDRIALSRDRVKIAIASGGNAKSGSFVVVVDDGK